jgi:hypothetical protein
MSKLQEQFAQDAAKLIQKAKELGYEVTLGEAWRTPQQAQWDADHGTGISCSLHIQRLAIDLNVFVEGIYQADDSTGCYSALGSYWKSLGSDHYWGGDFTRKDLDHYSISPDGGHTR